MPARWWPALHDLQPRRYAPLTRQILEQSGRDLPLQPGDLAYDSGLTHPVVTDVALTLPYPTDLLRTVPNELAVGGRTPRFGPAWLRRSRAYPLARAFHVRYLRWESGLRSGEHDLVGNLLRAARVVLGVLFAALVACAAGIWVAAKWLAPRAWAVLHPLTLRAVAGGRGAGVAIGREATVLGRRLRDAAGRTARAHAPAIRRAGVAALVVGFIEVATAFCWPLTRRLPVAGPLLRNFSPTTVAVAIAVGALLIGVARARRARNRSPEAQQWRRAKLASLAEARSRRFRGLSGGTVAGLPLLPAAYGAWSSLGHAGWSATLSFGQAITIAVHLVVGYVIGLAVLGIFVNPIVRRARRRRYRLSLLGIRAMSAALITTLGIAGAVVLTVALPIAASHASP